MMSSIIDDSKMLDKGITKGFTVREIKANSLLVILAGYETTASTLQEKCTIYLGKLDIFAS